MFFCENFSTKRQICSYLHGFGEVRGDVLSIMVPDRVMRLNVYSNSSAVFAGRSTSLQSNFTWTGSFFSKVRSWNQKTGYIELPDDEDHILCIPPF